MSNQNLANGAFLTELNGRRCTAVPKNGRGGNNNNNQQGNNQGNNPQATVGRNTNVAPSQGGQQTFSTSTASQTPSPSPAPQITPPQSPLPPPPPAVTTPPLVLPSPPAQDQRPPPSSAPPAQTPVVIPAAPQPVLSPSSSPLPVQASPSPSPPVAASPPPAEVANGSNGTGTGGLAGGVGVPAASPSPMSSIPSAASPPPAAASSPPGIVGTDTPLAPPPAAVTSTPTPQQMTEIPPSSTPIPIAVGTDLPLTTIGTAAPTPGIPAAAGTGPSVDNPTFSAAPSSGGGNGGMRETTIAVAAGVVGGVLAVSLVALAIWFVRKKALKKRRSTLLTPLSIVPSGGGGLGGGFPNEKAPGYSLRDNNASAYVINRGSIGPTPRTEKIKASLGYGINQIRDRFGAAVVAARRRGSSSASSAGGGGASVNMNRGNSQFIEDGPRFGGGAGAKIKEKVGDLWARVAASTSTWRTPGRNNSDDPFADPPQMATRSTPRSVPLGPPPGGPTGSPDFLTLLGMDDRDLQREAQRRGRSSSDGKVIGRGSTSGDNLLGSLGLNFGAGGSDPSSWASSSTRESAKPAPLSTNKGGAENPFSDANAISGSKPPPSTYVSNVRRSRGQTVGAASTRGSVSNNAYTRAEGYYSKGNTRESVNSVDSSFEARRNKFRSDPFDLERPELFGRSPPVATPINTAVAAAAPPPPLRTGSVRKPGQVHQRSESYTSKYSSGMSYGDWSDPGPDVGPAASRTWDSSSSLGDGSTHTVSPIEGRNGLGRSGSGASGGSVGKAL